MKIEQELATAARPDPADGVRSGERRMPSAGPRWRAAVVPGVPGLAALAMGLWGAGRLSWWRDEAVTAGVAHRPVVDILRFVAHLDAVHAVYYLFIHCWMSVFGASELSLRLPSIAAFAVAAAGTAILGWRLLSPSGGLLAGLLYTASPFANHYAHEARSYALVTALTVVSTILFLRLVESGTRRSAAAYGAGLVALGLVHLFALLVGAAHLVSLLVARRNGVGVPLRRCFGAVTCAALVLSPLVAVAASQRDVLNWLRRPGWTDAWTQMKAFAGGSATAWLLIAAVVGGTALARRRGPVGVRALALPWLVVPTATLMLISQVSPCYLGRYVIGSLPALALSAAAGLVRLPYRAWIIALVTIGVLAAPRQIAQRRPENWPDHLREAAAIVDRYRHDGDAIVYLPINRRAVGEAYPETFHRLRDIAMLRSPAQAADLGGTEVDAAQVVSRLRDRATTRVWLMEGQTLWRGPSLDAQNRAKVETLERDFRQTGRWQVRGLTLTLFAR
ncbi:glycosyltransferase family 39 protein [Actinoallomurus vinaceus]|uniref:glycosyltransferase family 39 protein n=1 Tax=Actinoallomurus vinaceus TaxID=1080074 RepID=UPI0031ECBE64